MDIYLRNETGILTPQGDKCDVFIVKDLGLDVKNDNSFAFVQFYETVESVEAGNSPKAQRVLEWPKIAVSDQERLLELLALNNHTTTSGDNVSLDGANIQP